MLNMRGQWAATERVDGEDGEVISFEQGELLARARRWQLSYDLETYDIHTSGSAYVQTLLDIYHRPPVPTAVLTLDGIHVAEEALQRGQLASEATFVFRFRGSLLAGVGRAAATCQFEHCYPNEPLRGRSWSLNVVIGPRELLATLGMSAVMPRAVRTSIG